MSTIRQQDFIDSIEDALQYISFYQQCYMLQRAGYLNITEKPWKLLKRYAYTDMRIYPLHGITVPFVVL